MARDIGPLRRSHGNQFPPDDGIFHTWLSLVPPERTALAEDLGASVRSLIRSLRANLQVESPQFATAAPSVARELAQRVLANHDYQVLLGVFRDALQEAAMRHWDTTDPAHARGLVSFFTTLTDAYWLAYSEQLRQAVRAQYRERLTNELRLAKRVQQRLLPKVIPQIPGWEIAGRLVPALEVGGDYWSVKHYPNDGVLTCKLADVTGHGVGAAILVAAVKFISGGFYRGAPSAAWVMERTNHVLVVETPSDIMVTMVYAWIRPETGHISLVNAGHGSAFTFRGEEVTPLHPTGPALGLFESRYSELDLYFQPGDILFFCSDGIIEARSQDPNRPREMYGVHRLQETVCTLSDLPASEIADRVIESAIAFSGTPSDDMSLVVVKRVDHPVR